MLSLIRMRIQKLHEDYSFRLFIKAELQQRERGEGEDAGGLQEEAER